MINFQGKVSEVIEKGNILKSKLCCTSVEIDKRYKVTSGEAETCSVATFKIKFVFFVFSSCKGVHCARLLLCQA